MGGHKGSAMARVAVAVALVVAAAALGDVPDTHDWFVVERGVMSDVGEGLQAGKPPLVPGMLVTLRGGSGNHHCGDASGGTACNHQAPTKHQKYRVVDAGRSKIGLHRGTAPFTGTVPSWVQFEGVKLSSGRVTIRVPGVGYCAGKRNGPSECSIDVRSSDAIEVECLDQCGRIAGPAKKKGKKAETAMKKNAEKTKKPKKARKQTTKGGQCGAVMCTPKDWKWQKFKPYKLERCKKAQMEGSYQKCEKGGEFKHRQYTITVMHNKKKLLESEDGQVLKIPMGPLKNDNFTAGMGSAGLMACLSDFSGKVADWVLNSGDSSSPAPKEETEELEKAYCN